MPGFAAGRRRTRSDGGGCVVATYHRNDILVQSEIGEGPARRKAMRHSLRTIGCTALVLALSPIAARAQLLTVVEVNAPAINCVFNATCTITVSDSQGFIPLPLLVTPKTAWLQSRTF